METKLTAENTTLLCGTTTSAPLARLKITCHPALTPGWESVFRSCPSPQKALK